MLQGIKLRLYPNKAQEVQLRQMFGNSRFLHNKMLGMMNERYKNNPNLPFLGSYKLDTLLPLLKLEYPHLTDSDSSSLQVDNQTLIRSWKNFFSNPKHFGKPRFKSRKSARQSYTGKSSVKVIAKRYMKLPKIGVIKTSKTGRVEGVIKRYTVALEASGKYYLSLQVESTEKQPLPKTGKAVGIDLGVSDLAILSDGVKFPKFSAIYHENQVLDWQKKMSKRRHQAKVQVAMDKNRGEILPRELGDFSNWQRARQIKARYQEKVANKRKDYLHKLTTYLVTTYDVIVLEDLKAKNLMKNHHLAKSIANASWHEFKRMLEYKCSWYGKKLITVPAHHTSQECSNCHHNSGKKPLHIREWTCESCGVHHDRDINASINILHRGLATLNQVNA